MAQAALEPASVECIRPRATTVEGLALEAHLDRASLDARMPHGRREGGGGGPLRGGSFGAGAARLGGCGSATGVTLRQRRTAISTP